MAIKQNWDNSRLADYLLYDLWRPYNAWYVLAGFDYYAELDHNKEIDDIYSLDSSLFIPFDTTEEHEALLRKMRGEVDRLRELWLSGDSRDEKHTPNFFIEWALSKRFRPDWLDWAIERGLYIQKQKSPADKPNDNSFDEKTPNYPPELDVASP